jgi:hypothetical protein
MKDQSKAREFWIGMTKSGWAKWLHSKDPEENKCPYGFVCSDASEICAETFSVIEYSAYAQALKRIAALREVLLEIKKLDTDDTFKDRIFGCGLLAIKALEADDMEAK